MGSLTVFWLSIEINKLSSERRAFIKYSLASALNLGNFTSLLSLSLIAYIYQNPTLHYSLDLRKAQTVHYNDYIYNINVHFLDHYFLLLPFPK